MNKKDVILKDEGEFITVICQTKKAKNALINQVPKEIIDESGDKFNIAYESKRSIEVLMVSHNLSWDEF